jgi:tRNA(Ile2) C34 agmatinyltransferase TiaS
MLPVALTFLGSAVYFVVQRRDRKALLAEVVGAQYALCPECAYHVDAAAQNPACTCPECGASVDLEQAQELWRAWAEGNTGRTRAGGAGAR